MRRRHFLALISALISTATTGLADSPQIVISLASSRWTDSPIIDLGYARYQGIFNSTSNITDFLGIRYAAPPTGENRFQAPKDPSDQSDVTMAEQLPMQCPQGGIGLRQSNPFRPILNGSSADFSLLHPPKNQTNTPEIEDCLYLNIQVSGQINAAAKMPVLFWIHGGGYVEGNITNMNGAHLISEAGGGIVTVQVQYRLGIFGFLPGVEVKKKGALNAGLLDQRKALEWVQKYIHLFGGDPGQVTIWGESAGADSVLQHLVANGGKTRPSLFLRAITSSTFLPNQYHFDDKVPEYIYNETAYLAGCSNNTDTFACLVAANASLLEAVNKQVCENGFRGTFVTVPVVDGHFIIERPLDTILKGNLNSDNILMMMNADEGFIFVHGPNTPRRGNTLEDYVANLMPTFNDAQTVQIADVYRAAGFNMVEAQEAIVGESLFICPTYSLLNAFRGSGRKVIELLHARANVESYAKQGYFAIPPALHGYDLPYYFPDAGPGVQYFVNQTFQASFAGAFTGMIKRGDPNFHPVEGIITPKWYNYKRGDPKAEMRFNCTENNETDIRSIPADRGVLARCDVWQKLAPVIPQ